jgi:protein TonB
MTAIRLPVSFALALCTTVTLFWFLGVLIAVEPALIHIDAIGPIQFSRHVPETDPITKSRPPKLPIVKPKETLVTPAIQIDPRKGLFDDDSKHPVLPGIGPGEGETLLPHGDPQQFTTKGGSDRAPVPQVRIDPAYPPQARGRGMEGWITFRFTVTTSGSVKDIEILESDPPHIWDSATLRAVSTWKYQPALKDGRPVEQAGVTATYRFEIER